MISLHQQISFILCVVSTKLSILGKINLLAIFKSIKLILIKL